MDRNQVEVTTVVIQTSMRLMKHTKRVMMSSHLLAQRVIAQGKQ